MQLIPKVVQYFEVSGSDLCINVPTFIQSAFGLGISGKANSMPPFSHIHQNSTQLKKN